MSNFFYRRIVAMITTTGDASSSASTCQGDDDDKMANLKKNQNKNLAQENRDPLVTLPLTIQFWSDHCVPETKVHPDRSYGDLNSMEVKSFATSKSHRLKWSCFLDFFSGVMIKFQKTLILDIYFGTIFPFLEHLLER